MFEFYRWLIFHSSLSSSPEAKGVVGQSFAVSVLGIYFHLLCKETQTNTENPPQNQTANQKSLNLNLIWPWIHSTWLFSISLIHTCAARWKYNKTLNVFLLSSEIEVIVERKSFCWTVGRLDFAGLCFFISLLKWVCFLKQIISGHSVRETWL